MKIKKFVYTFTLGFLFLFSSNQLASSEEAHQPVARWYKVYWSGLHIADLKASITHDRIDAIIESYGLVKRISKFSSKTYSEFRYDRGNYVPESFYTAFEQRRRGRKIDISYDLMGGIVDEAVIPPDNRAKRPAVDNKLKMNAVDPLTAVLIARQKVKQGLASGEDSFGFNIYDGRRLSRLDFNIHGKERREIRRKESGVIKVSFKRTPIAGYTNNELKRIKGEEPIFTIYLSDDNMMMPIKADAVAPLGSAVILFERDCQSLESCG